MKDQDIFEHSGLKFRVHIEYDHDAQAPWDREDGHGPVRSSSAANKRAGERLLYKDRHQHWYYDWQAACKAARRDGWNVAPYDAPNPIERAVQADFDRLKRWLENDWCYVGVCVTVEGDPDSEKYDHALWGIESDCEDYIAEVAKELAGECGKKYLERIAKLDEEQAKLDALRVDAERWRTLLMRVQVKELGTEFDPDSGKPHSPMFKRYFVDCSDLSLTTLEQVIDAKRNET